MHVWSYLFVNANESRSGALSMDRRMIRKRGRYYGKNDANYANNESPSVVRDEPHPSATSVATVEDPA